MAHAENRHSRKKKGVTLFKGKPQRKMPKTDPVTILYPGALRAASTLPPMGKKQTGFECRRERTGRIHQDAEI